MNVGSLFSGIGGLDYGLARAGFRHVFFCESDPWRRQVLAKRWPGVPVYDDVRAVGEPARGAAADGDGASADLRRWEAGTGLLCGGFPCQDLSVAGQRRGLMHEGGRSNLFFEFARIIDAVRPGWVLVENVPGLLSSNGGRDFGILLGTLADLGYGVAWRVLDSRFFGVPQRRRRVFILGAKSVGDPRAAAERAGQVLAVGSRCDRHPPAGTQARADVAGTLGGGSGERGWAQDTERMTFLPTNPSLMSRGGPFDPEMQPIVVGALPTHHTPNGHGMAGVNDQAVNAGHIIAAPLTKGSATGEGVNTPGRGQEDDVNIVAYALRKDPGGTGQGHNTNYVAGSLGVGNDGTGRRSEDDPNTVVQNGVRRLTPTECERLQGLPDDWTRLDDSTPDSRRYSALGDAVTANVGEWIGRRLAGEAG